MNSINLSHPLGYVSLLFITFITTTFLSSCARRANVQAERKNFVVQKQYAPPVSTKKEDKDDKNDKHREKVISFARGYLGVPYKYGGMTTSGMDCSALVLLSYKKLGVSLPRVTSEQLEAGTQVSVSKIKKGDLVFFQTIKGRSVSHVGIVTEADPPKSVKFIHASSSKGVREDELFSNYWKHRFAKAIRIIK